MRLRSFLSSPLLVIAVAAAVAVALEVQPGSPRRVIATHCRPGTSPAEGPTGDSTARSCVPLGQPETFQDLSASSGELAARNTAPFTTIASGAYMHAYAQRQQMRLGPANDGANAAWHLAGTPPECAAQTTNSTTCPPPGPDNGNYGYTGQLGFRTLTGRISSFAYDPGTQGHYFASPVVGGVWESRDGGATWRSIGDGLPTQTVGAIAYDAPHHRVIAGTGDNSFGGSGIAGHGIYYSDDDGANWHSASGIPDLALSFRVVVSPADTTGNTIYAATSKGLYRSDNGGASFYNENLPTSPPGYSPNCQGNTTTPTCFFANVVTDVIVKPTKTSNAPAGAVLAVVGWRAGQKHDTAGSCTMNGSTTPCEQAPQNGLYESDSGAAGSFKFLPGGSGGTSGFAPNDVVGRTALAVAHGAGQNSDAVYAIVQDAQKFNGCPDVLDHSSATTCNATVNGVAIATVLDGMYASYDFGKTWTKIMDFSQLKQAGTNSSLTGQTGYSPGIQAWYNLWVEADPTSTDSSTGDPKRVLFGLEEIWENNPVLPSGGSPGSVLASPYVAYPGGTAANDPWLVIGRYWNACGGVNSPVGPCNPNPFTSGPVPGSTTHPDQHAYGMIPDGSGGVTLVVGSDGGLYSQHAASGQNFSNDNWGDGLNKTLSAVQPYDAEMSKDGTIVSGLQDNGEMKTAPNGREAEIFGGDAFFTTIDPGNSKNIIEEYTYGATSLSIDGGGTWYSYGSNSCGSSTTSLFATPLEQDPTMPGHVLLGCTQLQEATNAYADPCVNSDGGNANNCTANYTPWVTTFDLSTLPSPNGAPNIPSALAVRGANEYVGYCGYCDPATQGLPFANGIATNVGGSSPPQIGTTSGWHKAAARCGNCQTANGLLPERYITSIQEDPNNPNTVYLTLGGYGRRWIPPGSFGEDTSNVGVGHVFVSYDHGEHFTNITGNLPDISANWAVVHDGQLVVGTDLGMYIETAPGSGSTQPTYGVLGKDLPAAPVMTVRITPANPDTLLVATYGRGDWLYTFTPDTGPGGFGAGGGTFSRGGPFCTAPTGRLHGGHLGLLALGMTHAKARATMPRWAVTRLKFDEFCLRYGWGIRAGYPTSSLLSHVSGRVRRQLKGRIVFLLTANRFYSAAGVTRGTKFAVAKRRLHITGSPVRLSHDQWYAVRRSGGSILLRVNNGVVAEIGVGDNRLLNGAAAIQRFFRAFQRA